MVDDVPIDSEISMVTWSISSICRLSLRICLYIDVGFARVRFIGECDLKKKLKFLWFILEIHRTVDNNNKTC